MQGARPRHISIIANPQAGRQRQSLAWLNRYLGLTSAQKQPRCVNEVTTEMMQYFQSKAIQATLAFTQSAEHATELAEAACATETDLIIAIGGDGTINNIVAGMRGYSIPLGIFPMGTANVFALALALSTDIKHACHQFLTAETTAIDIGFINRHPFISVAGIGFDAHVIRHVTAEQKQKWGAGAYLSAAIQHYWSYPFPKINIYLDDATIPIMGYGMIISNTPYYGGKLPLCPAASPTNGKINLSILKTPKLLPLCQTLYAIKQGQPSPFIDHYHAQSVRVDTTHPMHVDAEYIGQSPAKITLHPHQLMVRMTKRAD